MFKPLNRVCLMANDFFDRVDLFHVSHNQLISSEPLLIYKSN